MNAITLNQLRIKVRNVTSERSGREVVNQFHIDTPQGDFFQSYDSTIVFIERKSGKTYMDKRFWNYSKTTSKYRNQFTGLTTKETKEQIASGEIELVNLNGE